MKTLQSTRRVAATNQPSPIPSGPACWKWMVGSAAALGATEAPISSQAGTVQIDLISNQVATGAGSFHPDFTGDGAADVSWSSFSDPGVSSGELTGGTNVVFYNVGLLSGFNLVALAGTGVSSMGSVRVYSVDVTSYVVSATSPQSQTGLFPVLFTDAKFNGGAATNGFVEVRGFNSATGPRNTVQAVRLVFDDASTEAPTGVVAGGSDPVIGSVTSGGAFVPTPASEIDVEGNGISIPDGDVTPNSADGTDFGNRDIGAGGLERTFRVRNTGNASLAVTSTGSDSGDFAVSPLAVSIDGGNFVDFTVTFDPATVGVKNATITVNSDDADEAAYSFAVTGVGTNQAESAALRKKCRKIEKQLKRATGAKKRRLARKLRMCQRRLRALG